jgi:O-antigen/teichoic acid export membrane protein
MTSDFLKKFFTYGLGNILQSALSLILLPLYLRFLTPGEYGVISVLSVTMSLLALSISAGMMNGLIRLYYETEGLQRRKLIGTTWLWYLAVAALGGAILFTQARPLSTVLFRAEVYESSIRIVGVAFFFLMVQIVPFYILRLEKKAGQYVGFSLFNFLVDFALKLYFIVSLGKGIEGYFASSAIANMLTVGLMLPFVAKNVKLSPDIPALKQLLRLGFPYVFSGVAVWTIDVSDRLLLNHFSGEAVVGVYSVACNFANIFRVLLATPAALLVDPFFFAFAAARPAADTRNLLQRMLIYSFLAGGVLYLGITLSSGEVLRVLISQFGAKKEYLPAANLVPILTLAPFIYFLVMPSILGGLWVKKPEIFSVACLCAAGLNAGLNFFVIPKFGAAGAAVTTVIAYLLLLGLSYGRLERFLLGGYEWRKVARVMLYLALAFTIGWQIWIDQPVASLLVRVMVGILVFAFLTLFTGDILTKVERDKMLASIRS